MLIPRFTIRWLLLLMTGSAVFFLVVSRAVRGEIWAIALATAVASIAVAFVMYGAVFGVAYVLAAALGLLRVPASTGTPFATAAPPPQIVPPQEPDTF